jgi:hypothetical protein
LKYTRHDTHIYIHTHTHTSAHARIIDDPAPGVLPGDRFRRRWRRAHRRHRSAHARARIVCGARRRRAAVPRGLPLAAAERDPRGHAARGRARRPARRDAGERCRGPRPAVAGRRAAPLVLSRPRDAGPHLSAVSPVPAHVQRIAGRWRGDRRERSRVVEAPRRKGFCFSPLPFFFFFFFFFFFKFTNKIVIPSLQSSDSTTRGRGWSSPFSCRDSR